MRKKYDHLCLSMLIFPSLNIKKEGEYYLYNVYIGTYGKKILFGPLHKVSTFLRCLSIFCTYYFDIQWALKLWAAHQNFADF
jgi:hypothetical protein